MAIDKIFDGAVDGIADNLFNSVSNSVSEIKAMQQRKAAENVQLVVQALKKIDADIREKYDGVTETIEKRVANIKDGRDGIDGKNGLDGVNGKDGRDGKDGRNGRDGLTGPRGFDGPKGADGKDGRDGEDGVSVTDAHIDFDGSLIISLSSGRVINVGEVVAADIAEKIKVITNGGGTSQPVLDQLASLQAQIDLISSALVYKGTWNATTNTPTLTSSAGTANTFYIVSVAGTTTLNGISNWGVGDWAVYNGSVWQRIEGGAVGNFTDLSVSGTTTLSGLTASTALALNASKQVVSVTNTGSGNNVLATSPTLVTPVLGIPSSVTLTNATGLPLSTGVTGTLPIANGGTGQTSANAAFNALAPSQTGNSGKYLTTNGSTTSWATVAAGTVTSVAASVPSFLSVSGSPITTSGTLAFSLSGSALPTTSGGTGLTSFTADGVPYATSTSALETSALLKFQTANSALTIASTTTANGYMGFTNSGDGGVQGYIGDSKALMTGGIDNSLTVRGENTLFFTIASTEGMRLNSTGVGIGTSPGSKLDVKGTLRLSGSTSGYVGLAPAAAAGSTTYTLPSADGTANQALVTNGSGTLSWASTATGTVTSVAASVPSFLSISGSPITSSGTLAITLSGTALPTTSGGTGLTSFTANGVVYASSTSALTTGSALTFDGAEFGFTRATAPFIRTTESSTGIVSYFGSYNGGNYIGTTSNHPVQFYVNAAEGMRLTSTGLGIGTSSPTSRLNVVNSANSGTSTDNCQVLISSTNRTGFIQLDSINGANGSSSVVFSAGGTEQGRILYKADSNYMLFRTNNAEAVRIDSSGNVGIGTSSPTKKLHVSLATAYVGRFAFDATYYTDIGYGGTNTVAPSNPFRYWELNGSEQMRLTSTGLGIGTSSPAVKLESAGSSNGATLELLRINNTGSGANTAGQIVFRAAGTNYADIIGGYGASSARLSFNVAAGGYQSWAVAGSDKLTLDSSGNLGLGVTPSAWGSTWKAIQVGMGGSIFARTADQNRIGITANAFFDTAFKYIGTGQATFYDQDDGNHYWYNAPSGTAGNAITFTQAMTLDASGQLGVGTTSPTARLHAYSGTAMKQMTVDGVGAIKSGINFANGGTTYGQIYFDNNSPYDMSVLQQYTTGSLVFGTNNTERARIDSSGNLLVGQTGLQASEKFGVTTTGAKQAVSFKNDDNTKDNIVSWVATTSGNAQFIGFYTDTLVQRGSITYNRAGGLVVYNTTSDYRAKDITGAVTDSGSVIDSVPVYMGKMHGATQERPMFIAHETPDYAHTGEKDAVDADGNPVYQQMDASALIPVMWAEIQSLRKRLADAGI